MEVKKYERHIRNALTPSVFFTGTVDVTATAGRVYLIAYDIPTRCKLKSITVSTGATVSGNVTVGVYGPIATPFSPNGEALKATSADTALSGTQTPQTIALTTTPIVMPGQYYVAVTFSSGTHLLKGGLGSSTAISTSRGYYDQSYGDLPATFPALTASSLGNVASLLEVVPVP